MRIVFQFCKKFYNFQADTIYTFSTLFDFQYLPLRKNNPTDKHYEDLASACNFLFHLNQLSFLF